MNGAGKTTLLRILAGRTPPESGEVRWGRGTRIGFLEQQPELPPGTVAGAVGGGWRGEAVLDRLGMTPLMGADTRELSGGQAKRTALARVLLDDHDLLILDEPTNTSTWMPSHSSRTPSRHSAVASYSSPTTATCWIASPPRFWSWTVARGTSTFRKG